MNMGKIRFGTKEIIALAVGAVLFACIRMLEYYIESRGIVTEYVAGLVNPGLLVVAAVAVFFGPVSGMLCGIGGNLIVRAMLGSSVRFLELFTLGLYGFLIGIYYGKLHYRYDRFGIRELIDFNVVQVLVGILCGVLILPLGKFLIDGTGINEAVVYGTMSTIGVSITVGVILSLIMFIVSVVASGSSRRDT